MAIESCTMWDVYVRNAPKAFQTRPHPYFFKEKTAWVEWNNKYKQKNTTHTHTKNKNIRTKILLKGSGVAFDGLQRFNSSFFRHLHQHRCFQRCINGAQGGLWQWQCRHGHGRADGLKVTVVAYFFRWVWGGSTHQLHSGKRSHSWLEYPHY